MIINVILSSPVLGCKKPQPNLPPTEVMIADAPSDDKHGHGDMGGMGGMGGMM